MRLFQLFVLFGLLFQTTSWSQDTIHSIFDSKYHRNYDVRQYDYELDNCIDFMEPRFMSGLPDGIYLFEDSVSHLQRLSGEVKHSRMVKKWSYFDSTGRKRIEDVFFNDFDSIILTSYFDENGYLYRTKESSYKYIRTIHYSRFGMESYFYRDLKDSSLVHVSYFPNGQISSRTSTKQNLKNGEFLWTYDDGSLYAQHFYENGLKSGIWRSQFKGANEDWCTEEYQNDLLVNISFKNGASYIISKGEYEIRDSYPNGKLRLKGKVINGYKVGLWYFYNEKGDVIGEFKHDSKGNLINLTFKSDLIPGI